MEEKKPTLVFQKNVDKTTNKMIIPKVLVNQWGPTYRMEVYDDCIVLRPVKKED